MPELPRDPDGGPFAEDEPCPEPVPTRLRLMTVISVGLLLMALAVGNGYQYLNPPAPPPPPTLDQALWHTLTQGGCGRVISFALASPPAELDYPMETIVGVTRRDYEAEGFQVTSRAWEAGGRSNGWLVAVDCP